MRQVLSGAQVFDGTRLRRDAALVVEGSRIAAIVSEADAPESKRIRLPGGILSPGLVDLQVNGGGGRMVDGRATVATLAEICESHLKLGVTGLLPTLITDSAEATDTVISAGIEAFQAGVPGFLGLHLEGPHLDPRRKGAHDPNLIRPMTDADLDRLCRAARALPALMVTLAPSAATAAQIAALRASGVVVSLGHSDATLHEAKSAIAAGANCVTHLFNAMSQLGNREPGLVGAVLDGTVPAGLIADGIHVAPEVIRVALAARPRGLFLVSDAMAVAGTDLTEFQLGGRRILRSDGRLTLQDGTLAGADLSLPQAIGVMVDVVGLSPARTLAMATSVPARIIGAHRRAGHLAPGRRADIVHFDAQWRLTQVWRDGTSRL